MRKQSIPSSLMLIISFFLTFLIMVFGLQGCSMNDEFSGTDSRGIVWGTTMRDTSSSTPANSSSYDTVTKKPWDVGGAHPYDTGSANSHIGIKNNWYPSDARTHKDNGQKPPVGETPQQSNTDDANVTTNTSDAGTGNSGTEFNANTTDAGQKTEAPEVQEQVQDDTVLYASSTVGFSFDYPKSWKKKQEDATSVSFTAEKIVLPEIVEDPETAIIKVTFMPYIGKGFSTYTDWTKSFPKGSEEITLESGNKITLVDHDSEAFFSREYYKPMVKNQGMLHFEFSFSYAKAPDIEQQNQIYDNYEKLAHQYSKEALKQFAETVNSAHEFSAP